MVLTGLSSVNLEVAGELVFQTPFVAEMVMPSSVNLEVAGELVFQTPFVAEMVMPPDDVEDHRQEFIKVQCSLSILIVINSELSVALAPNLV